MRKRKTPSFPAVPGERTPTFSATSGVKTLPFRSAKASAALGTKVSVGIGAKTSVGIGAKASAALGGARKLTAAIGREAAANFKAWFKRNFVNPRAGRIGDMSYSRAGALDDHQGDWTWYPSAYGRAFWDHTEPLKPDEEDYIRSHPLIMFQLALGVTDLRGLRCLRRGLTLRANALQRKSYRSRYYDRENASRRALAAERRKIRRRTTTNPCPTPDGFREAFARVGESAEAKIRFGGMVHDLACYVDSCLRYDESGNIVGRNGGIKEWLADNVPELYPRYKTIMRYKALAMRVRQMAGINDPQPTSALLDEVTDGEPTKLKNYSAQKSHMTKTTEGGDGGVQEHVQGRVRQNRLGAGAGRIRTRETEPEWERCEIGTGRIEVWSGRSFLRQDKAKNGHAKSSGHAGLPAIALAKAGRVTLPIGYQSTPRPSQW